MSDEHEIRKGMWAGLRQADLLGCTHAAEDFREALGLNAFTDPAPQPTASVDREALVEELLPCPFCGGEASADGEVKYSRPPKDCSWDDGDPITEAFFCNCTRCGVSNKGVLHGHRTKDKAVSAWNRRADLAHPVAVEVKHLTGEDRDWINAEADRMFRESERRSGGIRPAMIMPQDFRDYFVVDATRARILSQITTSPASEIAAEVDREALIAAIHRSGDFTAGESRPETIADALLAAGWTLKREEG